MMLPTYPRSIFSAVAISLIDAQFPASSRRFRRNSESVNHALHQSFAEQDRIEPNPI
jgi:hypothetical protein